MLNVEEFRLYCLAKAGVTEELPFGPDVLVFKVGGKMFALTPLNTSGFQVNLKCDPERAIELRDRFPAIGPGYHMNKVHWNTLYIDGSIPNTLFKELIDHSYQLILASLPAAIRKTITE